MLEHWSFNYEDRIFPTPVIHLGILEKGIEELEWVLDHGAKIILIRPAPVTGYMGPRSIALPEFDPFWKLVVEAGIPVGMHASDSGYQRYMNEWEGVTRGEMTPFKGGSGFMAIVGHMGRPIVDTMASLIGHGLCSRFPDLRFAPVENGSNWVRYLLHEMEQAYTSAPRSFEEDPVEVFKRNIYVHPFHEEDPVGLIELLGADRVLFGSDYPHPEGMADPLSFVDELHSLPADDVAKIMGGNLNRLMGFDTAA
jgi:predicted TIM-barrel fold metal-dependent hydrolase